jgi:hypothetical protein
MYLQPESFAVRTGVYFFSWVFFARPRSRVPPALKLILLVLSSSFFAVDWIGSLDLQFRSTALGLVFFMSCILLAFGFHLVCISPSVESQLLKKLNNMHLALIGAWSYVVFVQYLVVWYGNIPAEVHWYSVRMRTDWVDIPAILAVLQFAVPVFLLFFANLKRSLLFTRALGFLTVFMQGLYLYWTLFPNWYGTGFYLSWGALIAESLFLASLIFLSRRGHV